MTMNFEEENKGGLENDFNLKKYSHNYAYTCMIQVVIS